MNNMVNSCDNGEEMNMWIKLKTENLHQFGHLQDNPRKPMQMHKHIYLEVCGFSEAYVL